MLNVLAKRWLTKGWRVMSPEDSETMALAWIEVLNESKVPYQHYEELFRRSVKLRTRRLELGKDCDDFSAEMMIACWTEYAQELQQQWIASGRYLPDTAASDCPRCFGAGMRPYPEQNGRYGPCNHEAA